MSPKQNAFPIVATSLACAAIMIFASYMMAGSPYREMVQFFIIAIWWIPFSFLSGRRRSCCQGTCTESDTAKD